MYTAVLDDKYTNEESIKCGERSRRSASQMQEIRNPQCLTPLPKQRLKMFSNIKNKANIANVLLNDWIIKREEQLEPENVIYLTGGSHDITKAFRVVSGNHSSVPELQSDHEEADPRMFLVVAYLVETVGVNRVILWSIDSDVASLCSLHCCSLGIGEFYLKADVGHKKRVISMHKVVEDIG